MSKAMVWIFRLVITLVIATVLSTCWRLIAINTTHTILSETQIIQRLNGDFETVKNAFIHTFLPRQMGAVIAIATLVCMVWFVYGATRRYDTPDQARKAFVMWIILPWVAVLLSGGTIFLAARIKPGISEIGFWMGGAYQVISILLTYLLATSFLSPAWVEGGVRFGFRQRYGIRMLMKGY